MQNLVYWLRYRNRVIPKYLIIEDNLIVIAQSIVGDIEILQLIMTTSYNI